MRTTVTIDPDTEVLLKEEMRRSGQAFKVVLNQAIRRSLRRDEPREVALVPLFKEPFPAELTGLSMNRLADELDDEETLRELGA